MGVVQMLQSSLRETNNLVYNTYFTKATTLSVTWKTRSIR